MNLPNRISELRKKYGFTQQFLADQLNTSQQTISKMENDPNYAFTADTLKQLSEILHASIDYILYLSDAPYSTRGFDIIDSIAPRYESLSREDKVLVSMIVQKCFEKRSAKKSSNYSPEGE